MLHFSICNVNVGDMLAVLFNNIMHFNYMTCLYFNYIFKNLNRFINVPKHELNLLKIVLTIKGVSFYQYGEVQS